MKKVIILENDDIENLKKGLVIECDGEKYALIDGVLNLVKTAASNKPTMRAVVGTRSAANVYKVKDDEYENIDATYKPELIISIPLIFRAVLLILKLVKSTLKKMRAIKSTLEKLPIAQRA